MGLSSRLQRLEAKADIKTLLAQRQEARRHLEANRKVLRQFGEVLDRGWPLLTEAQQEQLEPSDDQSKKWVLDDWLRSLFDGSSRLPDLAPETVLRLVLAWCDPQVYSMSFVCLDCGLCRPFRNYDAKPDRMPDDPPAPELAIWDGGRDYFKVCPHCQSERHTWTHLNRPERGPMHV